MYVFVRLGWARARARAEARARAKARAKVRAMAGVRGVGYGVVHVEWSALITSLWIEFCFIVDLYL